MLTFHSTETEKTCCRCGSKFFTVERERVCACCRGPRVTARENRNLSFREKQIVDLVVQGKANKHIAHELLLTEGTIKEYLNRIFRKVEVTNRTELAVWALTRRVQAAA